MKISSYTLQLRCSTSVNDKTTYEKLRVYSLFRTAMQFVTPEQYSQTNQAVLPSSRSFF